MAYMPVVGRDRSTAGVWPLRMLTTKQGQCTVDQPGRRLGGTQAFSLVEHMPSAATTMLTKASAP